MEKVGIVSDRVIELLNISYISDRNIYIGETNIDHMQTSHPDDYKKYGCEIQNILANPDYVGLNKKDNSIEYVKEYIIDNEYVKVAVRISTGKRLYAHSLYILNRKRTENFIKKGSLKKYN